VSAPRDRTVELDVQPASAWTRVSDDWRALAEQAPNTSFFLTSEWADAWMKAFAVTLKPEFLIFRSGRQVVGLCMLVKRLERNGPVPVTRIYLNMSGENEIEDTTIEYNDVLCLEGWHEDVTRCLAAHLKSRRWDEFIANGLTGGSAVGAMPWASFTNAEPERIARTSYYVDLAAARALSPSFEASIGPRSRKNVRRYMNLYRALGECGVEAPADAEGAVAMFDEMVALHQSAWIDRGKPGAFASARVVDLHRGLIRRSFNSGMVLLLRVTAGRTVLGVAHNFVFRGKVYAYQQGLRQEEDRRLHPGFVTTACVIQYCLDHGFSEYDHLAGQHIDKKALSTHTRPLDWVVWRRRTAATRAIDLLKHIRSALRRQPPPEPPAHSDEGPDDGAAERPQPAGEAR
jgi:hypothetical protein